ncbi:MAG: hypothetical protein R8M45_03040 [Ghiorsea sp.]
MIGLIRYTADFPVVVRSPYSSIDLYAQLEASGAGGIAQAGAQVDVLLDWGYEKLDPVRKDVRYTPSTPSGNAEVISHGWREGWKFTTSWVSRTRDAALTNDFEAMRALNSHMSRGHILWFPDYENYPDESVYCIAQSISAPKRIGKQDLWSFDFDLMELPSSQISNSLASLVRV